MSLDENIMIYVTEGRIMRGRIWSDIPVYITDEENRILSWQVQKTDSTELSRAPAVIMRSTGKAVDPYFPNTYSVERAKDALSIADEVCGSNINPITGPEVRSCIDLELRRITGIYVISRERYLDFVREFREQSSKMTGFEQHVAEKLGIEYRA